MMIRGVLCLVLAVQQFLIPGLLSHHHSHDDSDHSGQPHIHVHHLLPERTVAPSSPDDPSVQDATPDHEEDAIYLAADLLGRDAPRHLLADVDLTATIANLAIVPDSQAVANWLAVPITGPDHPPFYLLHLALLI